MGTMLLCNEGDFNHYNVLVKYAAMADRMVIISPFLSPDMPGLLAGMPSIKRIELYTNLDGYGMASSVISSINGLYEYGREQGIDIVVKYNDHLHGKAYLLYEGTESRGFLITSGNFTDNGLKHNHEYGVFLDNESLQIKLTDQISGLSWMGLSFKDVISLNKKAEEFMKEHTEAKQPVFKVCDYISSRRKIMPDSCKYFVKPLGNADRPVNRGYTIIDDNYIGFSGERSDISEGDFFVCHAVKTGNVLGICQVLGNVQKESTDFEGDRWNYKFMTECITEEYSTHWWDYDLKTFQLVREFNKSRKQEEHVTSRGTDSLGALQFGSQAVRVTREFVQFILDKIEELQ